MNENKSNEEKWREEYHKELSFNGAMTLGKTSYLHACRKRQEEISKLKEENEKLKKKTGFTYGFHRRECNNCGYDSSREN